MKSIIARLMYVTESKEEYITVARKKIGFDFRLTRIIPGEGAVFEQINSEDFLVTSIVKNVETTEENIVVITQNSKYSFKVI